MTAPPASATRFDDRVEDYVRYRPGYPAALIDWLHDELGVSADAAVADIGAGTGISSRLFLDAGHPVVAVEPNAAMRAAAERALGAAHGSRFRALAGTAEATALPDRSTDVVAAAQAFHWFDTEVVRREWARVLRPGGLAVVFWNTWSAGDSDFLAAYDALLRTWGTDYAGVAQRWQDDATMQAWFGSGLAGRRSWPNPQRLDYDALRGRLLSSSYTPRAGTPGHAELLAGLRDLFDTHARDGHVDFDYRTRAFAGRLDP